MPLTHHPRGVSSFGIPMIGGIPALDKDAKVFFVDFDEGDNGNPGTDRDRPLKTPNQANTNAVAGRGDWIVITGGSFQLTTAVTISKSRTHWVGLRTGGQQSFLPRINPPAVSGQATFLVQAADVEIGHLGILGNKDAGELWPAIFFDGDNGGVRGYVHDCVIENLVQAATTYCDGIQADGDRFVIERNIISNCKNGIFLSSGTSALQFGSIVQYNIIRRCNRAIYVETQTLVAGSQHHVMIIRNEIDGTGAITDESGIVVHANATSAYLGGNYVDGYSDDINAPAASIFIQNFTEGSELTA